MLPKKNLLQISLNHYIKHKIQSVLLILGVSLGVAVIVAIDIANNSARKSFEDSVNKISSNVTHNVLSMESSFDEQVYFYFRNLLGYENIIPVIEKTVYIDQIPKMQFEILGIDPFSDPALPQLLGGYEINLNSESFQQLLTAKNGALISRQLASELDIEQDDSFLINFDSHEKELRVIGIAGTGESESSGFNNKIIVDIATAQSVLGLNGRLTRIDLDLSSYSEKEFEEIKNDLNENFAGIHLLKVSSLTRQSKDLGRSFELNLKALSLITLLIAFFLIYNSFNYSLVARRPVFSILRSLGVTSKEVFMLILTEALILGLAASILGTALGLILGNASVFLVSKTLQNMYTVINQSAAAFSISTVIKAISIGVGAVVVAAIIPSIESKYITPVTLFKRLYFNKGFVKFVPYMFTSGIVTAAAGFYITTFRDSDIELVFSGLFLVIIGYTLILPLMMVFLGRTLKKLDSILLPPLYQIPSRNYLESIDKNYIATASLTVAVAVFLSMTVLIESFRTTLDTWLNKTFPADVFISVVNRPGENKGLDFDLLLPFTKLEGVENAGFSRKIDIVTDKYGRLNMIALSDNPPIIPQIISGDVTTFDAFRQLRNDLVLVSESFYSRHVELLKSGFIILPTIHSEHQFRIAGVFSDYATQRGSIILTHDLFRKYWEDNKITSISLNIVNDYQLPAVLENINRIMKDSADYRITTNRDLKQAAHKIFNQTFAITGAMRIIAFLVAFLGILGALLSIELNRKKEIGVLRSMGLTVSEMKHIIFFETGIVGFLSGVASLPLGYVVSYILVNVINVKSFGWTVDFIFHTQFMIEAVGISLIAALLAGIYPAYLFSNINISRALKEE